MGLFYRIEWATHANTPIGIAFFRRRGTAAYFTRRMLEALTAAHETDIPIELPKGAVPVGNDRAVAIGTRVLLTPAVPLGRLLVEEHGDIPPGFLIHQNDNPDLWRAALETTGKSSPKVILRDFVAEPIPAAERHPYPRARRTSASAKPR